MVTMQDVAEKAGVSKSTVSRVLSGKIVLSQATRDRVNAAIAELGFRPNSLAQALANQKSNTLGLVVSNFEGPYFGRLLKTMAQQAELAGKQLVVTDGHDDPVRERAAVELLVDRCCDAIILYSRYMPESDLVQLVETLPVPLMVMNRPVPGYPERAVVFDQAGSVAAAMAYLLAQGHQRIACISGPLQTLTARTRLAAWQQALLASGIEAPESWVVEGDNLVEGGYRACQQLLARGIDFTALFASNDDMAIGALRALREAGVQVPEQVSLFGFDDEPAAAYLFPALSTVHIPIEQMSVLAIQQALRLADGNPIEPLTPFTGQLRLRESCQMVQE
jgi:DNA-binding LacI/PurR family transcriptional regulator